MLREIKNTQLICDACQKPITTFIETQRPPYAHFNEIDLCVGCATTIIESLYRQGKFTEDDITKNFSHYEISARANDVILC